jgi:carbon storage regulator CsrA
MIGGSAGLREVLKVTVLEIRGSSVKLGFEADPGISVQRLEVWERIQNGAQSTDRGAAGVDSNRDQLPEMSVTQVGRSENEPQ